MITSCISSKLCKALTTPFSSRGSARESGMTIIEILIVIALIGTIMTIVMTNVLSKNDEAKIDLAAVSLKKVAESLNIYKLHNNRYPTAEDGLEALVTEPSSSSARKWRGPYTEADKLKDPWGGDIRYEITYPGKFKLVSAGPDSEMDTPDDISFPAARVVIPEKPISVELTIPPGQEN